MRGMMLALVIGLAGCGEAVWIDDEFDAEVDGGDADGLLEVEADVEVDADDDVAVPDAADDAGVPDDVGEGDAGADEGGADEGGAEDAAPEDVAPEDAGVEDVGPPPCEGFLDPIYHLCWIVGSGRVAWSDAVSACRDLSIGSHGPGSWHLPTVDEARSLIRGCMNMMPGGACGITVACPTVECGYYDPSCGGCERGMGPGIGGAYLPPGFVVEPTTAATWTSTTFPTAAWMVGYYWAGIGGGLVASGLGGYFCVRPA